MMEITFLGDFLPQFGPYNLTTFENVGY